MPLRCRTLLALLGVLLAGPMTALHAAAGPEAPPEPPGTLVELQTVHLTPMTSLEVAFKARLKHDLGPNEAAFKDFAPEKAFAKLFKDKVVRAVPSMGLRYASVDAHGHARVYSGRLFLPSHEQGAAPAQVPLVIYQHGTETERAAVPYRFAGAETLLGALGAQAAGMAVAMPDGDGMGADPSPEKHAYCHEATTSRCLLDLIRAIQGNRSRIFDGINYVWDGRLFLLGYSEGGYIAMAAVKELSSNPAWQDLKLTGAACMGGPFDLPGTIHSLLGAEEPPYTRPYIPAYLVAAWQDLYPDVFAVREAFNPKLLEPHPAQAGGPDQGDLPQWLDGRRGGDAITRLMQARLTGNPAQPVRARTVLNETWAALNLDPPETPVNALLQANSLVGGWVPRVPLLLAHDPQDECVPFSNTRNVFAALTRDGFQPMPIVELAAGGRGTGHVGGAVVSIPTAFMWFGAGMPSSLMAMAAEAITKQVVDYALGGGLAEVLRRAAVLATQDQNVNRAEFPLSRIDHPGEDRGEPWTLRLADQVWAAGKVKVYTLAPFPQFPGQHPVPGLQGYTRFVAQLKGRSDAYAFRPGEPTYIAVYPKHGAVALTLGFSRRGAQDVRLNIKQAKNKLFGQGRPYFKVETGTVAVNTASYERPATAAPLVALPQ
jgi:hypothetical protein